jgi:hypothetical protein
MKDTPIVVYEKSGMNKDDGWVMPTLYFYSTIRKLADYGYLGQICDNKENERLVLNWIEKYIIPSKKGLLWGTTDYKLKLVPANTVIKDLNEDARLIPVIWIYNNEQLSSRYGVTL